MPCTNQTPSFSDRDIPITPGELEDGDFLPQGVEIETGDIEKRTTIGLKARIFAVLGVDKFLKRRGVQKEVCQLLEQGNIERAAGLIDGHALELSPPETMRFAELCAKHYLKNEHQEWMNQRQRYSIPDLERPIHFRPSMPAPRSAVPHCYEEIDIWLRRSVEAYLQINSIKELTTLTLELRKRGLVEEADLLVSMTVENMRLP